MLAIVVYILKKKSPQDVVQSVIAQHQHVHSLHFVHPNVSDPKNVVLYEGWVKDRDTLENELNIKVHFDALLEGHNFEKNEIVVEVPYNCSMRLGDFTALEKRQAEAATYQTEFGIKTSVKLTHFSFAHGYLMILFILQLFISRFFNKKIYNGTDIRARFILTKSNHDKHYLAPPSSSFLSYFYMPTVMPYVRENAVVCGSGWSFTTQYLRSNRHLGFGFWVFFFIPLWVFLSVSSIPLLWAGRDIISVGSMAILLWLAEACVSYLLLRINVENHTWLIFHALLFPVYWITFPIVLVYSKV